MHLLSMPARVQYLFPEESLRALGPGRARANIHLVRIACYSPILGRWLNNPVSAFNLCMQPVACMRVEISCTYLNAYHHAYTVICLIRLGTHIALSKRP